MKKSYGKKKGTPKKYNIYVHVDADKKSISGGGEIDIEAGTVE